MFILTNILPLSFAGFITIAFVLIGKVFFSNFTMSQASSKIRVVNTIASWTVWILFNTMPLVYAAKKFSYVTPSNLATVIALSVLSPLVFWSVDAMTSPSDSARRNLKLIRKNGYSLPHIALYNVLGGAIFHFSFWFVGQTIRGYTFPKLQWSDCWDCLGIPATFVLNWCVSEVIFTWLHRSLHEVPFMANIHFMHHCTRWPGLLQTTTFNPIDSMIEIGPPFVTSLFTYYVVSKSKASLAFSVCALSLWYTTDHDETRNSHHTRHHLACSGQYTAYVPNVDFGAKKELVRGMLKKEKMALKLKK